MVSTVERDAVNLRASMRPHPSWRQTRDQPRWGSHKGISPFEEEETERRLRVSRLLTLLVESLNNFGWTFLTKGQA